MGTPFPSTEIQRPKFHLALEEKHACLLTTALRIILLKRCFVSTMTTFLVKGVLFFSVCCGVPDKQAAGQLGMCFSPLTSTKPLCSFALTPRDSNLALNWTTQPLRSSSSSGRKQLRNNCQAQRLRVNATNFKKPKEASPAPQKRVTPSSCTQRKAIGDLRSSFCSFPRYALADCIISKEAGSFQRGDRIFLCIWRVISTLVEMVLKQSMSMQGLSGSTY